MLKNIILYILIGFFLFILIQFFIENRKLHRVDELKIAELSLCESTSTIYISHPIDFENNIPLFYEILSNDSIISKKKYLETLKTSQVDSTDFIVSCSDSIIYLIYLKKNDTLLEMKKNSLY